MPAASVSVVIVCYNAGALLERCMRSVLTPDTPEIDRVIVSDNGSTDDSLNAIRASSDPRVRLIENGANLGFAAANNRALPLTTGDYLLFLNPDCVVEPGTIARMTAAMELYPEAGMAGCMVRNPDGSEQRGCRRRIPTPASALVRVLLLDRLLPGRFAGFDLTGTVLPANPAEIAVEVEAISGAFMFVRKTALDSVGPLDEGYFIHGEDLDWCQRFTDAGWKILFVPEATATHAQGSSSKTRPIAVEWHKHRGMLRFYRKFQRGRYPLPMLWLVSAGIWLRFLLTAAYLTIKAPFGR